MADIRPDQRLWSIARHFSPAGYPSIAVLPANPGDRRDGREAIINRPDGRKPMFNTETALQS
jgi:hypothetical protein